MIGNIDVKSSSVHFSVQLMSKYAVANSTIPYERVISSTGDGLGNGTFIVPKSGTYFFSYDGLNDIAEWTKITLYINSTPQPVSSYGNNGVTETMSQSVILFLNRGDEVKLVLINGNLSWGLYNTFNGYLVEEQLSL